MGILPTFKCIWVQQQNVRFGGFLYLFKVSEESNCFYHTYKYFQKPKKVTIKKYREERKMRVELKKGENPSRSLSEFFDITFWVKKLWHKIYRITLSEPVLCFLPPKYV